MATSKRNRANQSQGHCQLDIEIPVHTANCELTRAPHSKKRQGRPLGRKPTARQRKAKADLELRARARAASLYGEATRRFMVQASDTAEAIEMALEQAAGDWHYRSKVISEPVDLGGERFMVSLTLKRPVPQMDGFPGWH